MLRFPILMVAATLTAATAHAEDASPPVVGSSPATTEEIVDAFRDCSAAIGPGRADIDTLTARGWIVGSNEESLIAGTIRSQTVSLGKSGGQVINIVQVIGGLSVHCRTTAILASDAQFAEVRIAIMEATAMQSADVYRGDRADQNFVRAGGEGNRANILLGPARRISLSRVDGLAVPSILIANFPKRTD